MSAREPLDAYDLDAHAFDATDVAVDTVVTIAGHVVPASALAEPIRETAIRASAEHLRAREQRLWRRWEHTAMPFDHAAQRAYLAQISTEDGYARALKSVARELAEALDVVGE